MTAIDLTPATPEQQSVGGPLQVLVCTLCLLEAKQLAAVGKTPGEIPDPLPGVVMANGMLLCEVRHSINVGSTIQVAQPGDLAQVLGR